MRLDELSRTPRGLTTLALIAAMLAPVSTPLVLLLARHLVRRSSLTAVILEIGLLLLPSALFGGLCWWLVRRVHRGVVAETWTREQLTEGYTILRGGPFMGLLLLLVLAAFLYTLAWFVDPHPRRILASGWMAFTVQLPTWVSRALSADLKPPSAPPPAEAAWSARPRLFSSHWGQPPTTDR